MQTWKRWNYRKKCLTMNIVIWIDIKDACLREARGGVEVPLTCYESHICPACCQRWHAPCWWCLEESPPHRWSSPTGRSNRQADTDIHEAYIFLVLFLRGAYQKAYCHLQTLLEVPDVCLLCLQQLGHNEPEAGQQLWANTTGKNKTRC